MKRIDRVEEGEQMNVLVVGNNPGDLWNVFENLSKIPGKRIVTEMAFDLSTILDRLVRFKPNFILIDDNIGKAELRKMVQALLRFRKTREIPITVIKNSNYSEAIDAGVLNFILKAHLTGEELYKALKNSIKFVRTQRYLRSAYRRRKGQLTRFIR